MLFLVANGIGALSPSDNSRSVNCSNSIHLKKSNFSFKDTFKLQN